MRAAEARYPGYPETVPELMERAGGAAAETALELFPDARRWTVVCGGGSNGGDGRVMAAQLERAGREMRIVDAKAGETDLGEPDVIVDALFGTGFSGEPRADAAALIERINTSGARVFAIDLPSGVDASTGEVAGAAVRADATVTFHGRKVGLEVAPGRFHAGVVRVADIGLDPAETEVRLVGIELLRSVPRKGAEDNKYTAGNVLVVGGSRGLTGAPCLAAMAALRADAGYVTVAAPESTLPGARAAPARGGEASAAGRGRHGHRGRRRRGAGAGRRRRPRSRWGRGSDEGRGRRGWCGGCSPRRRCLPSSTPTRCSSSSRRTGRRRACSPRTRASWAACSDARRRRSRRTGSPRCARPPTASAASCS